MNVGTLTLRWPGILIGVLLIAAVLTACSDSPKPEEDTATISGDSGAWEEYEAFCSEAAQEELNDNEDYTNREVSTFYAGLIERMELVDPPVEIADWHDRVLAGWTAVKKLVDAEPQDAIFDPFILFSDSEILFLFGEVEEAFNEIPADVRERLAAAGCSDDSDSEPTDEGESDTPQPDATATADSGRTSTGPAFLPTCEPRSRDEAALVAFYNATDGPNWKNNTNWLTDAPLGDWAGVSANRITINGRVEGECVTQLSLRDNQMSGEIPAELGSLLSLADLDLSQNQLRGEISPELGNLTYLEKLNLSRNRLSGEIPAELGNLPNLQRLDLSGNQLSGEIPASLGSLPNLKYLYLDDNQLSGEIPVELGKVPNLSLDGNQLRGRILRPNGTNPQYAWDGSTIRVSWDAVDGADYYKVYHDDFFDSACNLGSDGRPRFCEELATDVTGTTYVHTNPTSPGLGENYYWVVSCNSDGCSDIDSENPAQLIGSGPVVSERGADASTATPRDTAKPTPTTTPRSTPTPQPVATQTATSTATPISTATAPSARDRDGDGLIEVDNLTQLDVMRWDLDGDGISDNADYAAAFADADTGTRCSVASCTGYELTTNLDFDTNGNGKADEGDAYWNGGSGWNPIGQSKDPFDATFEGGGHTISNLYIRRSPNVGLFGVLGPGSTVSGIGLVVTSVAASGYGTAGALAGIGHGVIEDSFADGLVAGCVDHIGGLVGLNDGSIANSRSAGNVASARRSSGSASGVITDLGNDLVGFPLFGSKSRTCYSSGGGLVGGNSGTIAGSHSTSVVSGFTDNFGGLAGVNSGSITDSYATGNVFNKGCSDCFADVGGLVGDNEIGGEITNSYATGDVSGQGDNFGGLAGANSGVIVASYAAGSVSGRGFADVGGLVGDNETEGRIITSYATGDVSGQGDNFGGLAGANSGVIVAGYAAGSVSGRGFADVGGLVGDNRYTGVITAAYAEGPVSGRGDRYGGLLGLNLGIVSVCFSTGTVPQSGGGLIDQNGNHSGKVTSCYWDTETSEQSDSDGGEGKTTTELQLPTGYTRAYADWNVDLDGDGSGDDPWIFGSATEYPVLNLETLDIDHGNLKNDRPPLKPQANAALCAAVNHADIEEVKAQIAAGIDVNDTCRDDIRWYDGITPLAIAERYERTEIEAILVEAGAVDAEG